MCVCVCVFVCVCVCVCVCVLQALVRDRAEVLLEEAQELMDAVT